MRQVVSGDLTIGVLMAFYTYVGMLFAPVMKIAAVASSYQEAGASWKRLNEVLAARPEIKERAHPVVLSPLRGAIEFKGVSFRYRGRKNENALSGIDLRILPGQSVALVGRGGAGKSTMISLLARFYDPAEGRYALTGTTCATCPENLPFAGWGGPAGRLSFQRVHPRQYPLRTACRQRACCLPPA